MPLNLLKKYNELLDLNALNESHKKLSLRGVFDRDITNNPNFSFKGKKLNPTPKDGIVTMETLFSHLTTVMESKESRNRIFDIHRSQRLHWVKFHIDCKKTTDMLIFSVKEPEGFRTYIYDCTEKYAVVLEPLRNKNEYYLLSAYYVMGRDEKRDKFEKKYKRRLPELL